MGYIKPMIIDSTFNPHLLGLLAHELGTDLTQGDPTDPADPAGVSSFCVAPGAQLLANAIALRCVAVSCYQVSCRNA